MLANSAGQFKFADQSDDDRRCSRAAVPRAELGLLDSLADKSFPQNDLRMKTRLGTPISDRVTAAKFFGNLQLPRLPDARMRLGFSSVLASQKCPKTLPATAES
jgi:hypothetical protein